MFVYLIQWEEKKMLNFNFLNNLQHWGDGLAKVEHEMKHKHDDFRQALNPNTMEAAIWLVEELKNSLDGYMNCLLYTSPSPRDGLLSRMPSSA